jgi:DNA helicase-2/ATP-dependent DNA helicase PcrA
MGVSAVPGSGKTHVLSCLAADLVARGLEDGQEVLIVTLVNSAVDNFQRRVAKFILEKQLLPGLGYRVRTLHGLAHDIVRDRPGLVGLSDDFQIVDDRASTRILRDVVGEWLRRHPELADSYLEASLSDYQMREVTGAKWPALAVEIATAFIKRAKDRERTPQDLKELWGDAAGELPLARMGLEVYGEYQARLARTGVDFDDLIRLALRALELDRDYLERLKWQWPYILEDEAQDSSRLQEEILRRLVGEDGNWVRVGDPNQAVYQTFTTADPEFLRRFMREEGVVSAPMPNSGRSTQSIIWLANRLVDWVRESHPSQEARDALSPPHIEVTPPGDPQPNPPDDPGGVHLVEKGYVPGREVENMVISVKRWLGKHPELSAAILAPRNKKGYDVVEVLEREGVPYVEILQTTEATRSAARFLLDVLQHLIKPNSAAQLTQAFVVWFEGNKMEGEGGANEAVEPLRSALRGVRRVEEFLWPAPGEDWRFSDGEEMGPLFEFRQAVRRWHEAAQLPIDQLILYLAQELFRAPADLALAYKLAVVLRQVADDHPEWGLPQLAEELAAIARNQRRFLGFSQQDLGFEPPPGRVTVTTMHKAKGLEWDRVYLMAVNNYNYPSGDSNDAYFSEKWFVRDGLNLEAEMLAQLDSLITGQPYGEREATERDRLELVKERLRLLYVGITRASRELTATWNKGQGGNNQPAIPFVALQAFWEGRER